MFSGTKLESREGDSETFEEYIKLEEGTDEEPVEVVDDGEEEEVPPSLSELGQLKLDYPNVPIGYIRQFANTRKTIPNVRKRRKKKEKEMDSKIGLYNFVGISFF